jgi:hypothetical protein
VLYRFKRTIRVILHTYVDLYKCNGTSTKHVRQTRLLRQCGRTGFAICARSSNPHSYSLCLHKYTFVWSSCLCTLTTEIFHLIACLFFISFDSYSLGIKFGSQYPPYYRNQLTDATFLCGWISALHFKGDGVVFLLLIIIILLLLLLLLSISVMYRRSFFARKGVRVCVLNDSYAVLSINGLSTCTESFLNMS